MGYLHPPCDGRSCAGGGSHHCVAPLRSTAAKASLTPIVTTSNGDCAFDTMVFWEGAPRTPASFKSLRIELSNYLVAHLHEATWQEAFVACGEYDPELSDEERPKSSMRRSATALAAAAQGTDWEVPSEVWVALSWALGQKERERVVAERLYRAMSPIERDSVLTWRWEELPIAATALAGGTTVFPSRRRLDVSLVMKRLWGKLLVQWLEQEKVKIHARLPWGTMSRFWKAQGGRRSGVPDKQLIAFARSVSAGTMTKVGAIGKSFAERRRRHGAGRRPKAPQLREMLFEWFCNMRGAIKTRLPLAALAAQARLLRQEYMTQALASQQRVSVPQVTPSVGPRFPTGVWHKLA